MSTSDDNKIKAQINRDHSKIIGDIFSHPNATPPERIPSGFTPLSGARGPSGKRRVPGQLAPAGFFMQQMGQISMASFRPLMASLPELKPKREILHYKIVW